MDKWDQFWLGFACGSAFTAVGMFAARLWGHL
jgi:hypothetical protein